MQEVQLKGRPGLYGLCVLIVSMLFSSISWAQAEDEFYEEVSEDSADDEFFMDVEEGGDAFGDELGDGDVDEFFAEDDMGDDFGLPTVTGLIVASDTLAAPLAAALTEALNEQLSELGGYETVPNDAILAEFEIMGSDLAAECAFDPVCMGRIGLESGIEYVVVGRVEAGSEPGTWATTLDLIDTGLSQIDNFVYYTSDDRTVAVQDSFPQQLSRLFRIRYVEDRSVEQGSGRVQRAIGWTAIGLGAAAIGAGAYFGIDFLGQKSDLEDSPIVEDFRDPLTGERVYTMTQRDAQQMIDDMDQSRNLSFALIGAGAGLAITGAVLLAINSGDDIYEQVDGRADRQPLRRRVRLSPGFARGGFSVQGGLEF